MKYLTPMGVKYITALEALCYAARDLPNHEAGTLTRLRTSLALAAAVAAGAGWLAWQAARDPEIPWLARHRPAEWILYPSAPSSSAHPAIRLDTVFRRAFELRQRPHGARLEARCFRACQVAVNGAPLAPAAPPAPRASSAPPAAAIWKDSFVADAAPLLRKGVNVVVVRVANGGGPPALWLSLAVADGPTVPANRLAARVQDARSPKREPASYPIVSDGRWEASLAGAAWRAARLATTPMSHIAQVSATDMRMPIQYALSYPARDAAPVPRLDWTQPRSWTFFPPDFKKFPLLKLAYQAQSEGGSATCTLNAADEVAVEAFLNEQISFPAIAKVVEETLDRVPNRNAGSVEQVLEIDQQSRTMASKVVRDLSRVSVAMVDGFNTLKA